MTRTSSRKRRARSLFRQAVRYESLETRQMMAVTAQLSGGLLQITMDADRDSALVGVSGNQLTVRSSANSSFDLSRINAIEVTSLAGDDQVIDFRDAFSIFGALSVSDVDTVRFATGQYNLGSVAIISSRAIEMNSFALNATGNIVLSAQQTISSTETGVFGFLGAVSQASSSIRVIDSSLLGVQIDLLASTTIEANADGDDSDDVNRDLARVKTVGQSEIIIAGRSSIAASGNVSVIAHSVQDVTASAIAQPTSNNASIDAALALSNVSSDTKISVLDEASIRASGNLLLRSDSTIDQPRSIAYRSQAHQRSMPHA